MKREELNQRLSKISTVWSVLRQAHESSGDTSAAAQQLLMERYGGAVRRYVLGALRDPEAADELTQEFALCLLRKEFHRADPERGRFRDYVKTVLFHLVSKYRRRQRKQPHSLPPDSPPFAALASPGPDTDRQFHQSWRDELLARTWEALSDAQPTFFTVLHFRATHPEMPSAEMTDALGRQLGKAITASSVRQTLHRARELFAELLLDLIAHSLKVPTLEHVEQELQDLNLLEYCRPALGRQTRTRTGD